MRHRGQEPPTAAQLEQLELPSSSARCLSNQLSNNADETQHSPMDPSGRISRVEDVISRVDDSVRDEAVTSRPILQQQSAAATDPLHEVVSVHQRSVV